MSEHGHDPGRGIPPDTADLELEDAGFWDDDAEELPPRPRRTLLTPLTAALALVLIGACGFIAGVLVEKGQSNSGNAAGSAFARRARAFFGGGAGGAGRGGAGGFAGGGGGGPTAGGLGAAVIGQVASLRGNTLYVVDQQGSTIKVKLVKGGSVTLTDKSSVSKVHPGDSVVVQGSRRSDGTVAASSIRSTASSIGGGALGGLLGGGGGFGGGGGRGGPGGGGAALPGGP